MGTRQQLGYDFIGLHYVYRALRKEIQGSLAGLAVWQAWQRCPVGGHASSQLGGLAVWQLGSLNECG